MSGPLAETMTRLADGPRSKWHDEVLPNGAGESWVCVPIGDVLAALPPSAPPALDVDRLARAIRSVESSDPAVWLEKGDQSDAIAAAYARLKEPDA